MTTTNKRLSYGTLGTSDATLYTVPISTSSIIKTLTLCNAGLVEDKITISLNNLSILFEFIIASHDTINIPLEQILAEGETIKGLSTLGTTNYYISGKEVA